MNKDLVGQSALKVAAAAGIEVPEDTRVLLVKAPAYGKGEAFSKEKMCPVMEEQVKGYGLWDRCSGVFAVDVGYEETFLKKEELYPLYLEKIKEYKKTHRMDVLCLGGAVFTDWKKQLENDLGIPVMEGIEMAIKAAQDM